MELRRRLQRLEISDDRLEQEKRISCLVFSGAALQSLPRRENAAHSIGTVTRQYLRHDMVQSQINALIMLRDGKIPSSSPWQRPDPIGAARNSVWF